MRAIETSSSETLPDILQAHRVVLFVNGSVARLGAINRAAVSLVQSHAPETMLYDVSRNRGVRRAVMEASCWDSFPQMFLNGEFIGGYLVLEEFFRSGEYARVGGVCSGLAGGSDVSTAQRQSPASLWRMDYHPGRDILVAASASGCIEIVRPRVGMEVRRVRLAEGWVNCVTLLDGGETAAVGLTDGTIRIVDPMTGRELRVLKGHGRWVNDLAQSPNGLLFSVSADRRLASWSAGAEAPVACVDAHDSCIWCVASDPGAATVATGCSAGRVKLWLSGDLLLIGDATIDEMCVTDLCWAGTSLLAAGYSGAVHVLNADLSPAGRLFGHRERVWTVTAITDRGWAASASGDGSVRLWNLATCEELDRIAFESMPISIAYVDSIDALAVGHDDGRISWLRIGNASLDPLPDR